MAIQNRTTIDRLMDHVSPEPNSGCWLWTGSILNSGRGHGYARIHVNRRVQLAHRVAYELVRGPIPEGLELDHLCRVRCCVNPYHLEAVAHSVNVLRGLTPATSRAIALAVTHCPAGHPYNEENTRVSTQNHGKYINRNCRVCARVWCRQYRERLKLSRKADAALAAFAGEEKP